MDFLRSKVKEIIREEILTKKTAHFKKVGRNEPSMGEQDTNFLEDEDLEMFEKIVIKNNCTNEEWQRYAEGVRAARKELTKQFEDRGFAPPESHAEPRGTFRAYLANIYMGKNIKKEMKTPEGKQ